MDSLESAKRDHVRRACRWLEAAGVGIPRRQDGDPDVTVAISPLLALDADGNYPAVEYARASLARNIIRSRVQAGLTQTELAKLAGIRHETLCRLERGQHTPSAGTAKSRPHERSCNHHR
jgi:DNA-binding XRE family transcriptional regulator